MKIPTPAQPVQVLHLEDDATDHLLVTELLRGDGLECDLKLVKTKKDFTEALEKKRYDLIISDFSLPAYDGLAALAAAQEIQPETPFIFFSGTMGEDVAVESLRNGAVDYILKQRPHRLSAAVRRALDEAAEHECLQAAEREHKLAEEKIHEQAALLDKAQDAIIVCTLDRKITFWNHGAERIYGWSHAEALGKNVRQLFFHGQPPPQIQDAVQSMDESGEWMGEVPVFTKDDRKLTIQARSTLVRDERGQPKSLLLINTDITGHKQLEEQFLRAQRLESLGVLVSGIAHDLNNTLLPIMIGVEILKMQPLSEDAASMVQTMENSARRSADMVKQMLLFARGGEANKMFIAPGQIVQEIGKLVSDTFPKTIRCEMRTEKNLHPILAISTQIHQVLMNLCVNARDAMDDSGTITLTVENEKMDAAQVSRQIGARPGNYVCISVGDTGAGIAPEQMEKIFQPFYTTKAPGKGTGLGLSTCQSILKNHAGFITVQSQLKAGTQFKVYFPAAGGETSSSTNAPMPPGGHGEHILIVDDEEGILAIARAALENFGYKVFTAASGMEAVLGLRKNCKQMQLVITDHALPFMDGPALIGALRNVCADIPIIVTGLDEKDLQPLQAFNPAGFLAKPFSTQNLLAVVHQAMRKNS